VAFHLDQIRVSGKMFLTTTADRIRTGRKKKNKNEIPAKGALRLEERGGGT